MRLRSVIKATNAARQALEALDQRWSSLGIESELSSREEYDHMRMHLLRMLEVLESGSRPVPTISLGMGRMIVDSWPLDSELGNQLCGAEQAFRSALDDLPG